MQWQNFYLTVFQKKASARVDHSAYRLSREKLVLLKLTEAGKTGLWGLSVCTASVKSVGAFFQVSASVAIWHQGKIRTWWPVHWHHDCIKCQCNPGLLRIRVHYLNKTRLRGKDFNILRDAHKHSW